MILKSKTLATIAAIAVGGFAFTSGVQAATPLQKIQVQLQKLYGPTVVIITAGAGQTYATDDQFAAAVLASIKTTNVASKNSPKAALTAAFGLAIESNPHYAYASTTILKTVTAGLAKNTTQLNQAIAGAFAGFSFPSVSNSKNSAAAALVDAALLGISSNTSSLSAAKLQAAYVAATKTAVKASIAANGVSGASVGAAAQFANNSSLLSAIIKAAVSKASASYSPIAQAVATAIKAIDQSSYSDSVTATISSAVLAGFNAGYAAAHGGALPSKAKRLEVQNGINVAIAAGLSATSAGAGASGLQGYAYSNLSGGPVTDIYGL